MAEVAIKIGDSKESHRYADGDVADSFNRRRIRLCHAEMICHPRVAGKKVGGLAANDYPLLRKMLERTYRYKWEHVSRAEIKRTNLWIGGEVVFGSMPTDDPNRPPTPVVIVGTTGGEGGLYGVTLDRVASGPWLTDQFGSIYQIVNSTGNVLTVYDRYTHGEAPAHGAGTVGLKIHCHVEEHFAFRHRSAKLPIFGAEGAEVEYGDRSKRDAATTELIWDDIEHDTPLRRVDHDLWPAGIDGLKVHLFLAVDEFDDEEAEELVAPLTKVVPVTEENPGGFEVIKKRKHHIDWEADVAASLLNSATVADVRDQTTRVDIRAEETFVRANVVKTKVVEK